MFDVPYHFSHEASMTTWPLGRLSSLLQKKPVSFNFTDIEITAGADVAFATAVGHCVTIGNREPLDFRLTMGLRKVGGR
jgi:ketosteroid isomerase-like protein